jgi:hypothetical protein
VEKRDSCVRKLKAPIVSEEKSEIKIKQLKAAIVAPTVEQINTRL